MVQYAFRYFNYKTKFPCVSFYVCMYAVADSGQNSAMAPSRLDTDFAPSSDEKDVRYWETY